MFGLRLLSLGPHRTITQDSPLAPDRLTSKSDAEFQLCGPIAHIFITLELAGRETTLSELLDEHCARVEKVKPAALDVLLGLRAGLGRDDRDVAAGRRRVREPGRQ